MDPLSITMALFVTGVSTAIHMYSVGYMHGDPGFDRFFVYLNLFPVLDDRAHPGGQLLVLFLGWEGVGFCSTVWSGSGSNARSRRRSQKAFVTNRVGDSASFLRCS